MIGCFRLRSIKKTKTMNLLRIKYLDNLGILIIRNNQTLGDKISQKPEIFLN